MSSTQYAVFQDRSRHTCILISETGGKVEYLPAPQVGLAVTTIDTKSFHAEYKAMPEYPVQRAAESYAGMAISLSLTVTSKVREHLDRILGNKALNYDRSLFHPIPTMKKEITMSTKNEAPKSAADKATKNKAATKAPDKKAPTKAPAKQAAKAATGKGEGGEGGTKTSKYADKKITKKADHTAREGSIRAAILDKILKAKNTSDVLGVEVSDKTGDKIEAINPGHIGWAINNGLITIA